MFLSVQPLVAEISSLRWLFATVSACYNDARNPIDLQ